MKTYSPERIKNVALLGHQGSGKTTLVEAMLFEAGVINRRGNVEDHNTVSDYHEIEHERGNSIFSSILHIEWKDSKINLIDTPGFDDFIGEIIAALKVADTGVLLVNAQHGIEIGTEIVAEYAEQFNVPMVFAVNQVDHEKADFDATIEQLQQRFGSKAVVVQYPLQPGPAFRAIVDVLKMVVYEFPVNGGKPSKKAIPESEKERAAKLHNKLVEAAAENDDTLMERYFEKGSLEEDEMREGLKKGLVNRQLFPIFCLSAKQNMGSGRLLGFITDTCPSAADRQPIALQDGNVLPCDSKRPTALFVFKTVSEAHLGEMSFFKVFSGEVHTGDDLINATNNNAERLNQLFIVQGKNRFSVNKLVAGDIGSTVKLKSTRTNDTLHAKGKSLVISPIVFPAARVREAIKPLSKDEEEKIAIALHHLQAEDPTFIVEHSPELKQIILHGQGELHLAIKKWQLEHQYKLVVQFEEPRIPYRETVQKAGRAQYRHKKQSGGAGQFAEVHMLVEPWYEGMPQPAGLTVRGKEEIDLKWGGKLVYLNCIVGGVIDQKFMPSILKGVMEKMQDGPLTGSYVRDVRVSVYDGKMHPVDSNDISFKIAGLMAFKQAFEQASPQLLEPIYEVEVFVPEECMGEVMGDLQTRRASILGMETAGRYQVIKAKIPLAEMNKYHSALRSLTQGRAKFTCHFSEYVSVPFELQQKLVAQYQKSRALLEQGVE